MPHPPAATFQRIAIALALLIGLTTALPRTASAAISAPDVVVVIHPTPSLRAQRGGVLDVTINVANNTKDPATALSIAIPLDSRVVSLANSRFEERGDWVSSSAPDRVVVTFGVVKSSRARSAQISLRVSPDAAPDAVVALRGSYTWSRPYGKAGGSGVTNWSPVLVGATAEDSAYVWVGATPAVGVAADRYRFFSDRFMPGEVVNAWVNTQDGVRPLDGQLLALSDGSVRVDIAGSELGPGAYSMVFYGNTSGLTGVVGFIVR